MGKRDIKKNSKRELLEYINLNKVCLEKNVKFEMAVEVITKEGKSRSCILEKSLSHYDNELHDFVHKTRYWLHSTVRMDNGNRYIDAKFEDLEELVATYEAIYIKKIHCVYKEFLLNI